jgi:4-amino-4-deoxy-L-arabinose transferase-like glycosyltransferase
LYPQIDWAGNTPGYVESEFHIYPFIVSMLYSVFGINDMWGRLVSVICSVVTVYFLYLIVRRVIDERAALWSAFIYAIIPLNIYYGRAFMPESMMLMCSAGGIYFFIKWYDDDRLKNLFISSVLICLAILIKLPGFYLGLPLVYLAYKKYKIKFIYKPALLIYAAIIFIPVILWYYHAHQLFLNGGTSFDIWNAGESKWAMFGLLLEPKLYQDIFLQSIAERHLTYPGFILCVWGLFIKRKYELEKLVDFWLIAVVIYILIAAQANRVHEYYQLPIILPFCIYIGKVFAKYIPSFNCKKIFIRNKLAVVIVLLSFILIPVLSFLRIQNTLRSETYDSNVFKIADAVKQNSIANDLIVTVCDGNPIYLYISQRKGWTIVPQNIDEAYLKEKCINGARLLTAEKKVFINSGTMDKLNWLKSHYQTAKEDEDIIILRICEMK